MKQYCKLLRIVSKSGHFIRDDFKCNNETEIPLNVNPAEGLYSPRWDFENKEWVEGLSKAEVEELKAEEVQNPTLEDRLKALEQVELDRTLRGF